MPQTTTPPVSSASPDAERLIGDVEQFVREAVSQLEPDPAPLPRRAGRPRIVPALCLWAGMLICVLKGFSSQLDLWRLLSLHGLWSYPLFDVTDQAIYKRLAGSAATSLEQMFAQISALLRLRWPASTSQPVAPWASEVLVLDETTLDPVVRKLPALREVPVGDARLLPGKLAGLFDVRRQQWRRIQYIADPHENDKVAAPALVADLPADSLLLADLGYFSFAWFDRLTEQNYWWVSRLRAKTSYTIRHIYYQDDGLLDAVVWLGAYRADRAAHAVRLIRLRHGERSYTYITNVIDPHRLTAVDIARLYGRRWDIEMAFNLVKTHLNLHLLWSAKTAVILHQVWAVLIISQIIQALHQEIARQAGVDPAEVSMALLIRSLPQFAERGRDPILAFVHYGRKAHMIRPSLRVQRRVPDIPPDQIQPLPPDLLLTRTPRYAERKCGRGETRK